MPEASTTIAFTINGAPVEVTAHPMTRLLDAIRTQLHLTGTKEGCGEGECGACGVLLDGELVNSCLVPVAHARGAAITTIEGLAPEGELDPVQRAFLEHGGAQCGICTPGMVLAVVSLLERHADPSPDDIRAGLSGNLCRCTGYVRIVESVVAAVRSGRPA